MRLESRWEPITASGQVFDAIDSEQGRIERVDQRKRQIETLIELGGTVWGNHAQEQNRTFHTCFEELARFVEGIDVVIVVENFPRPGQLMSDRIAFLNELDHPQVGFSLDTGHELDGAGENPVARLGGANAIIEQCSRRLKHIHMHGFKDSDHYYPPMCDGDRIPWVELVEALHAAGYRGLFNFEPVGEPRNSFADTLDAVANFPEVILDQVRAHGNTERVL